MSITGQTVSTPKFLSWPLLRYTSFFSPSTDQIMNSQPLEVKLFHPAHLLNGTDTLNLTLIRAYDTDDIRP